MECLLGIDDTDSSRGLCTTYLAYRIATGLDRLIRVKAYPRLVRLNPNVPFKTRGNAAVCIPIETDDPAKAFDSVKETVTRLSDVAHGANSGVVFVENPKTAEIFLEIYERAISGLVNSHRVKKFLEAHRVRNFTLGNGMGLVGAAACLAFDERFDHTYELIAYRKEDCWGTKRMIDSSSVREMDQATFPNTFNNYDYQKRKVLIAPHGPDPVFAGIRGESPSTVISAFKALRFEERLDGYMVYLSNQHTDAHLLHSLDGKVYSAGSLGGLVLSVSSGIGGHIYLSIQDDEGLKHAAVYEPTGDLRRAARMLDRGDVVRVYGGIRRGTTRHAKVVNVEKMEVLSLRRGINRHNPTCAVCGVRMKSEGRGKGFQCRKCGRKLISKQPSGYPTPRVIVPGIYVSSPRSNRHLTKPLCRYGNENAGIAYPEIDGWLSRYITPMQELDRNRR
jgi:tRNA(Ile2)-agmatinylcytidine synthase